MSSSQRLFPLFPADHLRGNAENGGEGQQVRNVALITVLQFVTDIERGKTFQRVPSRKELAELGNCERQQLEGRLADTGIQRKAGGEGGRQSFAFARVCVCVRVCVQGTVCGDAPECVQVRPRAKKVPQEHICRKSAVKKVVNGRRGKSRHDTAES